MKAIGIVLAGGTKQTRPNYTRLPIEPRQVKLNESNRYSISRW